MQTIKIKNKNNKELELFTRFCSVNQNRQVYKGEVCMEEKEGRAVA
jgi:hypothetical protein